MMGRRGYFTFVTRGGEIVVDDAKEGTYALQYSYTKSR
jgi:hypothetical protein